MNRKSKIQPLLKLLSGFAPDAPDKEVREYWEEEFPAEIEKPCGVLLWCPYGPLVEDFPFDGMEDEERIPQIEPESCEVFGHHCPAFYVAEPFMDPEAAVNHCLCEDCRRRMEEPDSDEHA